MKSPSKHPFKEIVLGNGSECYAFESGFDEEKRLRHLSKVNVFVGANNSGKSRLMRLLAGTTKLNVSPNFAASGESIPLDQLIEIFKEAKTRIIKILTETRCEDICGARGMVDQFPLDNILIEGDAQIRKAVDAVVKMTSIQCPTSRLMGSNPEDATRQIKKLAQEIEPQLATLSEEARSVPSTKKLYIPTLRSLRDLGEGDAFRDRTEQDYFRDLTHVEIFTGRTLYKDIEKLVRGDLKQRETLRRFETWIGETFFRGEPVAIIPRIDHSTLTIKIGEEKEQEIHNLGDGIQAVLILAFPLFVHQDEHLLAFIEEPELFLHPWLQRVFLEMLSSRFPLHQYFLTTHSNHFLDLTLDVDNVSVYSLEKELEPQDTKERPPRYKVTNVSRSDRRPLELLGVRNSSVLLTNCTIWVEGITDRRYIAHWLKLYQEDINTRLGLDKAKFWKEDLHYSFVEYSGGNITHWSFLDQTGPDVERLCGKLFLIADADDPKPNTAKADRQRKLAAKLGNRFYLLPVREIENLLTPETLIEVLVSYGEAKDNLKSPKQSAYANKPLGKFIEEHFFREVASRSRKAGYAGDSGTVSDKVNFCARSIEATQNFGSLSEEARKLAQAVYEFIQHQQA